ncbi:hypothetical protein H2204_015695, partial [Knufia peltigerae]
MQGAEMASSLITMILDFGSNENFLWKALCADSKTNKQSQDEEQSDQPSGTNLSKDPMAKSQMRRKFWEHDGPINVQDFIQATAPLGDRPEVKFSSSDEVTSYVLPVWYQCISIVTAKVGDRNILPFLHFTLSFLWGLSDVPETLIYLEDYVPWDKLVLSLNSISRSGVIDNEVEASDFPQQQSGTGRQLPEDFLI